MSVPNAVFWNSIDHYTFMGTCAYCGFPLCTAKYINQEKEETPVTNYVYCAVDKNNKIRAVKSASRWKNYFQTDKYLKEFVKDHNNIYPKDILRIAKFKLVECPEYIHCNCYHITTKKEPRYNTITGQIDHYEDVEYGVCWGTKECDMCSCGGNEKKCDFYDYKRK